MAAGRVFFHLCTMFPSPSVNTQEIINSAKEAVQQVAGSIQNLTHFLDQEFVKVVELCYACQGRIVVSGIGKSAIIAQKMVATFNSTGTPALYMHAADAIHGDLGMVQPNDVAIVISKSGNSPEIKVLVPLIKNMGNRVIGMVGNLDSSLAKECDLILNTTIDRESCPNNLAPTTSTTAQLVMGDTLAVCLIKLRDFSKQDFAKYHPGGALGKKLYTKVSDIIATKDAPQVGPDSSLKAVILEISAKRLGATAVIENNQLIGVITDGDLRRMLEKSVQLDHITAREIMTQHPKTIGPDKLAFEAFSRMEELKITQLVVVDPASGHYKGLIHLHDILKEGIF